MRDRDHAIGVTHAWADIHALQVGLRKLGGPFVKIPQINGARSVVPTALHLLIVYPHPALRAGLFSVRP